MTVCILSCLGLIVLEFTGVLCEYLIFASGGLHSPVHVTEKIQNPCLLTRIFEDGFWLVGGCAKFVLFFMWNLGRKHSDHVCSIIGNLGWILKVHGQASSSGWCLHNAWEKWGLFMLPVGTIWLVIPHAPLLVHLMRRRCMESLLYVVIGVVCTSHARLLLKWDFKVTSFRNTVIERPCFCHLNG